jgi:DNA repair exonuclease SbcCD nuclease subunit
MKIAIIADSHFDERSRFVECQRIHTWIAQDAQARGCTIWLHGGDVYERKSTPTERLAVAQWCQLMTNLVGPGVIVRGNHDAPEDLSILGELRGESRIEVVERARLVTLHAGDYYLGAPLLDVACLPWPHRAGLLDGSRDGAEQDIAQALRNVLLGLSMNPAGVPRILLSHAMVRGSTTSHGQPLLGCDCELGLEDLASCEADFYALGHIHMPQDWDVNGAPAVYPGSPRRTAFGEVETKGYIVVEFDGPHLVGWERVPTPCSTMILATGNYDGVELWVDDPDSRTLDIPGGEIRLRYSVDAEHQEAAKAAAAELRSVWIGQGAVNVQLEPVVNVTTRARCPEVAQASTLADQLDAHWASKQDVPDDVTRGRLLDKLGTLEGTP